jgi:hypothetical protein
MKYRLDEDLIKPKSQAVKRFVWIEPYHSVPDDPDGFTEHYTENYRQIDLIAAFKDIANHQINFDPNHREGLYNS